MSNSQALAKNDPRVVAFDAYRETPDYLNTRNWALHEKHVDGSLWAAFIMGWEVAQGMAPEGRGREGGPGSSELPSPVGNADAPKGES